MKGFSFFELENLLKGYYINDYISSRRITDFEFQASQLVKHKQHSNYFISISSNRWNKINKRKVNWVDGNQQILNYYNKCELIITENPIEQLIKVIPQLIVKNSYEAMIILTKGARAKMENPVIGITGSVGKTRAIEGLSHIIMLFLLFKKKIEPTKVSSLNKWVTDKGESIHQKPFRKDEMFNYIELVEDTIS